jgi:diadenylate cyclase
MSTPRSRVLHAALAQVAPGTPLREGLDRIVKARMGALVVVGGGPNVLDICSGGFLLDAAYSPQRLSELAKMDGAIILATDTTRIARANVHLLPDPSTATSETGTRHRTAERTARSLNVLVISVSEDMSVISIYVDGIKHVLEDSQRLLNRANQALQTLERYKARLDDAAATLSTLEVENLVRVRDVAALLQRSEMVRRIAEEIDTYTVELGAEARLIRIQLDELMSDVEDDRHALIDDYLCTLAPGTADEALQRIAAVDTDDLMDLRQVAAVLCLPDPDGILDAPITARGYRLLQRLPDIDAAVAHELVERFGDLPSLQRATARELTTVAGVDDALAASIKGDLQLGGSAMLSRYS